MPVADKIIIAVLFVVFIVGAYFIINPAGRAADYRNEERVIETQLLLDTIHSVFADRNRERTGPLAAIDDDPQTVQIIANGAIDVTDCAAVTCADVEVSDGQCYANLAGLTAVAIDDIPADPVTGQGTDTRYYVNIKRTTVTVGACDPEPGINGQTPTIEFVR